MIMNEIILIRGLFRSKEHWGSFPQQMQNIFPNSIITCVDIPGNGFLFREVSPYSISNMVENIRKQRKGKGKAYIFGISMGGMVGLKWAEIYPEEVQSIICINTSASSFSRFYHRLRPKNYFRIIKAIFYYPSIKREEVIYKMVSNKPLNKKIIDEWSNYSKCFPISISNFFRQLLAAKNFSISKPKCELFFIASKNDNLVNFKATKAIAEKWNIPVIINKFDGHDIALDNPGWLLNISEIIWSQD